MSEMGRSAHKFCVQRRTLLRLPDGGTIGIDVCPPSGVSKDLPEDTPIVIVQHGLSGGSHEPYVRSILAGACAPKSKGGLGYRAIVVNFRGCQSTLAGIRFKISPPSLILYA
jgi:predicted alpha/beta-fold hydrolase